MHKSGGKKSEIFRSKIDIVVSFSTPVEARTQSAASLITYSFPRIYEDSALRAIPYLL